MAATQNTYVVCLDLETLGVNSQTKTPCGKAVEIMFHAKTGALYEKPFQVAGAVLAQMYCKKFSFDGENQGPTSSLMLNVQPYTQNLSAEAIDYAKKHGTWDLKGALPIQDALTSFLNFIPKTGKVIFVAHNGIKFDFPVIALHLERQRKKLPVGPTYMMFDSLYALKRKIPGKKSYKLGNIYHEIFNKSLENAHTADADTNAMFQLLEHAYGSREGMLKAISLEAKEWKPDISFSLHGMCTMKDQKKVYLSKNAISTLESRGWMTRAALTHAHKNGIDLGVLDSGDLEVIKGYCSYRLSIVKEEPKKESPKKDENNHYQVEVLTQGLRQMALGDQISKGVLENKDKLLGEKTSSVKVKVPGCGKGVIDALFKKHGRAPIVGDLIDLASEAKGDFDKFRQIMIKVAPTLTEEWSKKIWQWLTTDQ
jgi:hypothetical protein